MRTYIHSQPIMDILRKMNSQGFLKKEYQNLITTKYDKILNQDLSLILFSKASHVQNAIYTGVTLTSGVSLSPGLILAVFNIVIPIFGTLIWACPNLILTKIETTVKHSSSFLIKSAT